MSKVIDYLVPALLGAAVAILVLGMRLSSLEEEISKRAPIVIADPYVAVASLPVGTSESEMKRVAEEISDQAATLAANGYVVLKPSSVLNSPSYLELSGQADKEGTIDD